MQQILTQLDNKVNFLYPNSGSYSLSPLASLSVGVVQNVVGGFDNSRQSSKRGFIFRASSFLSPLVSSIDRPGVGETAGRSPLSSEVAR